MTAAPATHYPESFWRSLKHLNGFRLYLAAFFILSALFADRLSWLSREHLGSFLVISLAYAAATWPIGYMLRERHPGFDYCFSYAGEFMNPVGQDVSTFDLLELHIWMCSPEFNDFHQRIGYDLGASKFDPAGYPAMQRAEAEYRKSPEHWRGFLDAAIDAAASWSRITGLPLATTECWGPINYRDWPMLDWGWVREVCEHGLDRALATGRWKALATSNFCGPQFRGMWRDIDWHRRLTSAIGKAAIAIPARGAAT